MLSLPTALYVLPSLSLHEIVDLLESVLSSISLPSESLKFDEAMFLDGVSNEISPFECLVRDILFFGRVTIPLDVLAIHNVPSLSFRMSL